MRLLLGLLADGWSQRCWIALTAFAFLAIHAPLAADDEAKSGPSIQIVPPPKSSVFAATFSKDGRQIALACEDKVVTIHDATTGKLRFRLEGHAERVWTAAFSPDGATLASCSGEYSRPEAGGAVKLWDLKTGKEKVSFTGHRGLVFHVTFSPDGKTLLSAGWDGAVKLWDVATGREKTTLTEHTGPVRTIVYSSAQGRNGGRRNYVVGSDVRPGAGTLDGPPTQHPLSRFLSRRQDADLGRRMV